MVWAEICGRRRSYGPSEQVAKEGRCQLRPGVWLEVGCRLLYGLAEQVSNARRCQTRRAAISCRPEQVHLQRFPWRIRYSSSSGTGERVTSGTFMPKARKFKSTKFGLPWPTRSHPPAPPRPTPRAQDQVATLPLSGSFRCFELPFSRRGWPWCCTKFLFWGALEGDRLAALRRTGTVRTRGWVLSWR